MGNRNTSYGTSRENFISKGVTSMVRKILLLFSFIFPLASCSQKKTIQKTVRVAKKSKPAQATSQSAIPRITVWIHGTKSWGNISDHIHATKHQGLAHHTTITESYRIGGVIQSLIASDPAQFPAEHFYVFGWSGKLSFDERMVESKKLQSALHLLVENYRIKYGIAPHLTLIAHSHGGNVALNLCHVYDEKDPVIISQLILLACPVQHETKHLIAHDMFEKVYSLYSSADTLQVLDPQGMYLTEHNKKRHLEFSDRRFPIYPNLRQVKLKINGHGIIHIGFITKSFIRMLPYILDEVEQWHLEAPADKLEKELLIKT